MISETITITLPINFFRDLHSELSEGVFRDVIGHFYFLESFPPDIKESLRAQGYDPEQFNIHK